MSWETLQKTHTHTPQGNRFKINLCGLPESISSFLKNKTSSPTYPLSPYCTGPPTPHRPYTDYDSYKKKSFYVEVLGAFGIQLEKKIQKLPDDPGHIGFVFFPRRKILSHLFLISPSLSFNHLANTALEQVHVEIHFQNSVFLRASYTYLQGMSGREELKIPNRARSESTDF